MDQLNCVIILNHGIECFPPLFLTPADEYVCVCVYHWPVTLKFPQCTATSSDKLDRSWDFVCNYFHFQNRLKDK
uniref:Uncharacterized protein n=1 Tax=Octopus bimaculoides TaxID=37653 RepID=A0A0L8G7W3_OCTBM